MQVFDPAATPEQVDAADADRILPVYELQLSELIEEFLTSQKISSRLGDFPIHIAKPNQPTSMFKFKPLPLPLMPYSPNSVFQLSAFTPKSSRT